MSGICCLFNVQGEPVDSAQLQDMTAVAPYLGPDGVNYWLSNNIGFGHQALNTTPESKLETQPYTDGQKAISVVADVRLDNREDLIKQLKDNDLICSSNPTDVELIAAAYLYWGDDHAKYLIGDFAYMIWDQNQQRLLCVRDPFGSRPLYYSFHQEKTFIAASQLSQIFAGEKLLSAQILDQAVAYWMIWQPYDFMTENTFFKNAYRVKPAHVLEINNKSRMRQWRYWGVNKYRQTKLSSDEEYSEAYLYYYKRAVKAVSRSLNTNFVMTSGGMDSTSIVCMLNNLSKNSAQIDFEMLSILYEDDHPSDEKLYIDRLANEYGLRSHAIDGMKHLPFSTSELDFTHLDEPPRYSNGAAWIASINKVRDLGSNVVIIGQNSDALFSIQPAIFASLARKGKLIQIFKNIAGYPKGRRRFLFREAIIQMTRLITPSWARSHIRNQKISDWINPRLFQNDLQTDCFFRWGFPNYDFSDPVKALQNYLITDYSYPVRNSYSQIPLINGVEVRDPFIHRDLVEFLISIPASQILNNGETKYILRNAMKNIMPDMVRQRHSITSFDWLIRQGLTDWLTTNLTDKNLDSWQIVQRGYVLPGPLKANLSQFNALTLENTKGQINLISARDTLSIARLLLFENWLRSLT